MRTFLFSNRNKIQGILLMRRGTQLTFLTFVVYNCENLIITTDFTDLHPLIVKLDIGKDTVYKFSLILSRDRMGKIPIRPPIIRLSGRILQDIYRKLYIEPQFLTMNNT